MSEEPDLAIDSIQPANSPAHQEPPDSGPTTATTECQDNESSISQTSSEQEISISSSAMSSSSTDNNSTLLQWHISTTTEETQSATVQRSARNRTPPDLYVLKKPEGSI